MERSDIVALRNRETLFVTRGEMEDEYPLKEGLWGENVQLLITLNEESGYRR